MVSSVATMHSPNIANTLRAGSTQLDLQLSADTIEQLGEYVILFDKWNKTYNLSAIRDIHGILHLHLLDSLSICPHITGERLIDVGTGGGLPGIPLAILYPDREFTLLDSAGKKTRFLFHVTQTLGLKNVHIENRRVESFQPAQLFDGVVSRAYASLDNMIKSTRHLLTESGYFWAMKGQIPYAELSEIEKHYIVVDTNHLKVPGVDAERCLLKIQPRVGS